MTNTRNLGTIELTTNVPYDYCERLGESPLLGG